MIPNQQQHRGVPQFGFGFPQQQQQPMNLQHYGFDPVDMQMTWQGNNSSMGGLAYGQHMPIQPPPFLYPVDSLRWTEDSSRRSQVAPLPMMHANQNPLVTPANSDVVF